MEIRAYRPSDQAAVIELWRTAGLVRPWNDPEKDIRRKLQIQPEMFLVGVVDDAIVATVMAGYEGHRGWVNYLAVAPAHRKGGLGRAIMDAAEHLLSKAGCPKINLQVRGENRSAIAFYRELGYEEDDVVSLGKRLVHDVDE